MRRSIVSRRQRIAEATDHARVQDIDEVHNSREKNVHAPSGSDVGECPLLTRPSARPAP